MSMIDRYQKKGGFLQLLALIETTGPEKKEKFLKIIADENPAWEHEIKKKMLSIDKICGWNPSYLMEVFSRIPTPNVAAFLMGCPAEKRDILLSGIPFAERRKIETIQEERTFSLGEINSSVMKMMTEIRNMTQMNLLKFEKFDQDMVVPDNIEDMLSSGRIPVSEKEIIAAFPKPPPSGGSAELREELSLLRRRMVEMTQENLRLQAELQSVRTKLEQIRKIA